MRVLAIGECMAELSPTGSEGAFKLGFAGDTFNTAWYLAQISPSTEVSYFTAVGGDPLSADLRAFMRKGGLLDDHVAVHPNRTLGLYMISLSGGERSFSYWRGASAARELARDPDGLRKACASADLIYFSGITLAILDEPSRQALLGAIAAERALGKVIVFDPNLRPGLWDTSTAMTETMMKAATVSDVVLPSFEDEATWFGDPDPQATLERYLQAGSVQVVVKNGDAPVTYADGAIRDSVEVNMVSDVVDTTAAGDSFNAGVLKGLLSSQGIGRGVSLGCDLARWVVSRRGAIVSLEGFEFSKEAKDHA